MAYEAQPIRLELRASRDPKNPDEIQCSIRNLGSTGKRRVGSDEPDVVGVVSSGQAGLHVPRLPRSP